MYSRMFKQLSTIKTLLSTYFRVKFESCNVDFPDSLSISILSTNAGILLSKMTRCANVDLCSIAITSRSIPSGDSNSLCRPGSTWLTRSSVKVSVFAAAISEVLLVQLTASSDAVALYLPSSDDSTSNRILPRLRYREHFACAVLVYWRHVCYADNHYAKISKQLYLWAFLLMWHNFDVEKLNLQYRSRYFRPTCRLHCLPRC